MKKNLRQSLAMPERKLGKQQLQNAPQILPGQEKNLLKVSPLTNLPTRGDQIQTLYPPEQFDVKIDLSPTNSTPINERPPGSVRYEFVGKNMVIIPTGGERVTPTGMDSGPIRKKHKKKDNILKAFQK